MPELTRPTIRLSLLVITPAERARDKASLAARVDALNKAQAKVRRLALFWASERGPGDLFEDFEAKLNEASREVGRASTELMLACAETKNRLERPARVRVCTSRGRTPRVRPRDAADRAAVDRR